MPLSAAEKQRRYRACRDADPERRAKYLKWEKEKWRSDKEQGKKKNISGRSQSEQMSLRRKWREDQAKRRAAKKAASLASDSVIPPPPVSPDPQAAGPSRFGSVKDARTLFEALARREASIKLLYVEEEDIEEAVQAMPSTVRLDQAVALARGCLICRDVSCMCATRKRPDCECSDSKAPTNTPNQPSEVDWNSPELIGKWCVARYDGNLYPGIVMAADQYRAQIKCMHRIGENIYFWPLQENSLWYLYDDVVCFIPAPCQPSGEPESHVVGSYSVK